MLIEKKIIERAKNKLGDRNAILIAEILNVQQFDPKNLKGLCPFHQEDTPSFIYNKKNMSMHCFGCGKTVDIIDALMYTGKTFIEAVKFLFESANIRYSWGEYGVKTRRVYRYPARDETDTKEKVYDYLGKRRLSPRTIDYLDIQQDKNGNCVFNFYDTNDVLTMVKYRPSHKIEKGKEAKTWCQKDADTAPLLFNMNRINTQMPLLITEGELDCASAIESGYLNAVSVPLGAQNYQWIEANWDWLEQFESIILCSDNDEAGEKMRKEVVCRLGTWRTRFVEIPFALNDHQIKDLNELLYFAGRQAVLDAILNSKDTPVDSVVDFSDIQAIDVSEMGGIKTGYRELDKQLMKLFYGTFNIVTGINGSGKSSFLTQLLCQCLEQQENAFIYSGELPNYQLKSWINFVLAGQRNIVERHDEENDLTYYMVNKPAPKQIDAYYKGRLFVYKDSYSHKADEILNSMEGNARKHGCKLFILDNLTSIQLGGNERDKWQKQEEFINKLVAFANKFQVVVILVVHPHKIETMRRLTKMDVQGISAVIDLAHRILSLYRVQDADKEPPTNKKGEPIRPAIQCDVLCDILKDRMRGKEGKSIPFYYDQPSRRFFTSYEDLDYQYSWDKTDYTGIPLPFPPEQLENLPY